MVTTQTKKKALACRVSNETFDAVTALTVGENPPFESVSEYLYTLVLEDLGRRSSGERTTAEDIIAALKNPEVVKAIKCAII